jgi:hypothetical protein
VERSLEDAAGRDAGVDCGHPERQDRPVWSMESAALDTCDLRSEHVEGAGSGVNWSDKFGDGRENKIGTSREV